MMYQNVEIKMQARGLGDEKRTTVFVSRFGFRAHERRYLLLLCFSMGEPIQERFGGASLVRQHFPLR